MDSTSIFVGFILRSGGWRVFDPTGPILGRYGVDAFSQRMVEYAAIVIGPMVARYIEGQRDRLARVAMPLPEPTKLRLRQHFTDFDLDRVRVVQADPLPIPDPPLYAILRWLRLDIPGPSSVAAITFDHLIATREEVGLPLLFHELVHVVQFRLLGVKAFSRLYVKGFFAGGGYHGIPLERCAFEMEQRYVMGKEPFDVEVEIAKWIDNGLF